MIRPVDRYHGVQYKRDLVQYKRDLVRTKERVQYKRDLVRQYKSIHDTSRPSPLLLDTPRAKTCEWTCVYLHTQL